jgi:hypothetical protein
MTAYTKQLLSGTPSGSNISLTNVASSPTLIHQTQAGSSILDEVWLWGHNSYSSSLSMSVFYGTASVQSNQILISLPTTDVPTLIVPGWLLTLSSSIVGWAQTGSIGGGGSGCISVNGFINRITNS